MRSSASARSSSSSRARCRASRAAPPARARRAVRRASSVSCDCELGRALAEPLLAGGVACRRFVELLPRASLRALAFLRPRRRAAPARPPPSATRRRAASSSAARASSSAARASSCRKRGALHALLLGDLRRALRRPLPAAPRAPRRGAPAPRAPRSRSRSSRRAPRARRRARAARSRARPARVRARAARSASAATCATSACWSRTSSSASATRRSRSCSSVLGLLDQPAARVEIGRRSPRSGARARRSPPSAGAIVWLSRRSRSASAAQACSSSSCSSAIPPMMTWTPDRKDPIYKPSTRTWEDWSSRSSSHLRQRVQVCGGGKPVVAVSYGVQNDVDTGIKGNTGHSTRTRAACASGASAHRPLLLCQYLRRQFFGRSPGRARAGRRSCRPASAARSRATSVTSSAAGFARAARRARLPRREGLRVHERRREGPLQWDVGLVERLLQRHHRVSVTRATRSGTTRRSTAPERGRTHLSAASAATAATSSRRSRSASGRAAAIVSRPRPLSRVRSTARRAACADCSAALTALSSVASSCSRFSCSSATMSSSSICSALMITRRRRRPRMLRLDHAAEDDRVDERVVDLFDHLLGRPSPGLRSPGTASSPAARRAPRRCGGDSGSAARSRCGAAEVAFAASVSEALSWSSSSISRMVSSIVKVAPSSCRNSSVGVSTVAIRPPFAFPKNEQPKGYPGSTEQNATPARPEIAPAPVVSGGVAWAPRSAAGCRSGPVACPRGAACRPDQPGRGLVRDDRRAPLRAAGDRRSASCIRRCRTSTAS